MMPPIKQGAALARLHGPVIETERLILRPWRATDIAPNTAMLSDPATARFITADHKAVTDELVGWRNAGPRILHRRALRADSALDSKARSSCSDTSQIAGSPGTANDRQIEYADDLD